MMAPMAETIARFARRRHTRQLRHNAATELRRDFGIGAAPIILGHRSAAITEVYAENDQQQAMEAILRVGMHLRAPVNLADERTLHESSRRGRAGTHGRRAAPRSTARL